MISSSGRNGELDLLGLDVARKFLRKIGGELRNSESTTEVCIDRRPRGSRVEEILLGLASFLKGEVLAEVGGPGKLGRKVSIRETVRLPFECFEPTGVLAILESIGFREDTCGRRRPSVSPATSSHRGFLVLPIVRLPSLSASRASFIAD